MKSAQICGEKFHGSAVYSTVAIPMTQRTLVFLLIIFAALSCHSGKPYTEDDILSDLDDAGVSSPYKFFPDLGHGYFALSDSRVTLFADEHNWAIVFEKTGYGNREHQLEIE